MYVIKGRHENYIAFCNWTCHDTSLWKLEHNLGFCEFVEFHIIMMFNSLRCVLSWYILCRELVCCYVENVHLSCVLYISISFWKDVRVVQTVHEAKNNWNRRWFIRCSWLLWLHGIADCPLTHKLIEFEYSRSEYAKYLLLIKK